MKRSWIDAFVVVLLVAGLSGCASVFVRAWTWNGAPSTGQKVRALAFDVVTMPVQIPFWIAVGIGTGLDKLSYGIEDNSWRSKRNGLHGKFLKDPAKMQNVAPEFCSKGLSLGLVYADEVIPLSEKFLVAQVMQYFAYVRPMGLLAGMSSWPHCCTAKNGRRRGCGQLRRSSISGVGIIPLLTM